LQAANHGFGSGGQPVRSVGVALRLDQLLLFFWLLFLPLQSRVGLHLDWLLFLLVFRRDLPLNERRDLVGQRLHLHWRFVLLTRRAGPLDSGIGHPHHFVGDPIGFLLVLVARLTDDKLRLDDSAAGVTGSAERAGSRSAVAERAGASLSPRLNGDSVERV